MNQFGVGAVGKRIQISNMAPQPTLTPREALELAAHLVATALPLQPGDDTENLGRFLKQVAHVSGEELAAAIEKELEE
jgi:hypothetical protein